MFLWRKLHQQGKYPSITPSAAAKSERSSHKVWSRRRLPNRALVLISKLQYPLGSLSQTGLDHLIGKHQRCDTECRSIWTWMQNIEISDPDERQYTALLQPGLQENSIESPSPLQMASVRISRVLGALIEWTTSFLYMSVEEMVCLLETVQRGPFNQETQYPVDLITAFSGFPFAELAWEKSNLDFFNVFGAAPNSESLEVGD